MPPIRPLGFRCVLPALLAFLPAASLAAQLPDADPESVGMSAARLARIQPLLEGYVERGEVAGVVTFVARDGRMVARNAAGVLDLGSGAPMREDALFRIASMTKPVTSVAIMMLVEQGRLALSDPVSRYLPEFTEMQVAVPDPTADEGVRFEDARRQITIRDLLTHRSGITYGFLDDGYVGDRYRAAGVSDGVGGSGGDLAENIRRLAAQPLVVQPGSAFRYGLSTDVLGRVVEVVTGQPLDRFFEEAILLPLGMPDTRFRVQDESTARLAGMHARPGGGPLRAVAGGRGSTHHSGGAGLFSTAADYIRFGQMLLDGGEIDGVRLLGPKTVELMTASHTGDLGVGAAGAGRSFGLGFGIVEDLGRSGGPGSVGLYGWSGVFGTTFWVDPVEKIVAVGMIQLSGGGTNFREGFQTAVYQAIVESRALPR